jgi:hypothetical protein
MKALTVVQVELGFPPRPEDHRKLRRQHLVAGFSGKNGYPFDARKAYDRKNANPASLR